MPEIDPENVPSPRTLLAWDGIVYRPIHIDALGNVQIDVVASNLPAGAATAANQALEILALALIGELRGSLQTIASNRLIVRGENQLFSFAGKLLSRSDVVVSGAGGYGDSASPPANRVWVVTNIAASDRTSPTTQHTHVLQDGLLVSTFYREVQAFAATDVSIWGGHVYLVEGDVIRIYFAGSLVGDTVRIDLTGYTMTLEV